MASPAYERILAVQALDLDRRRLQHRHAHHPIRVELASAEAALSGAREQLAEVDAELHDLERDIKRLADEVESLEAKRKDIDDKLYGGTITASKELLALQEEGAGLGERQRRIEDGELEIMERHESRSVERDRRSAAVDEAATERTRLAAELNAELAVIDAEVAKVTADRADAAAMAPPELLTIYERLAVEHDGVAVARFVDGHCDGCHMQLSAVAIDQMKSAPDDAVVTCEECGRLLVR